MVGNSGTGKKYLALKIGLAAIVNELIEARDSKQLQRTQKALVKFQLLIVDELGIVPLSKTGAELLFDIFSQRH